MYMDLQNAHRVPVATLWNRCIVPTAFQGETAALLAELFAFCLLLNFVSCLKFLPRITVPLTSSFLGLLITIRWFDFQLSLCLVSFALLAYIFLYIWSSIRSRSSNYWPAQYVMLDAEKFSKLRGSLMILIMKIISLSFDHEFLSEKSDYIDIVDYCGYVFNVATIKFGPWYSFQAHKQFMERYLISFFGLCCSPDESIASTFRGFIFLFIAFVCLIMSSCFIDWLIFDEYIYYTKYIVGYKEATSFRFSHYFICFVSESAVLLTGNFLLSREDSRNDNYADKSRIRRYLEPRVCNPLSIEFPRSLTNVVVSWNIPMHNWLKMYAFRPSLPRGKFFAIIFTYIASSALHGFNFSISAVLLSLGLYTYAEYVLREKLSRSFDACIRARKCSNCEHKHKNTNVFVLVCNLGFLCLSVFHLIYLGMIFDSGDEQEQGYSSQHVWRKWNDYNFLSFYVGLGTFVFAIIV
uniref:Protein-serine O-palmitoleoyltransferase porcupine n=1 Tax=Romanomermis culicivorax TaxID=13658 RepID=A0A915J4I2_ROMCU